MKGKKTYTKNRSCESWLSNEQEGVCVFRSPHCSEAGGQRDITEREGGEEKGKINSIF